MSGLEQKLYQLIISRLDGDNLTSPSYRDDILSLASKGLGGFIIFGGQREEVRTFISKIQKLSDKPLFIASDIERGVGQQISGTTSFPSAMAVAASINPEKDKDINLLESMLKAVSDEAHYVGINMPLIPVLDVNYNPDNPIICTRAFSDDSHKVAWFGSHYIKSLESSGLISCAKHFPGHGDTSVDSHISLPVISKSVEELWEEDLAPFRTAVNSGVSSIMAGHLSMPALDTMPASLSKKTITDLLRKEIGFQGLVLTDALNMHALNEFRNVPSTCLNAGVDILLHPADSDSAVKDIIQALESGELDEEKVNTAYERVLRFKSKLSCNHEKAPVFKEHENTASLIHDRSIAHVKNTPGILPVADAHETSLVFTADENTFDISPLKDYFRESVRLDRIEGIASKETIIFALFTSIAAWKGSSGIKDEDIRTIKTLIRKSRNSIVIAFGSPYVLEHFQKADVLIAACDSCVEAQHSVIRCLKGEGEFQGSLPVTLKFF